MLRLYGSTTFYIEEPFENIGLCHPEESFVSNKNAFCVITGVKYFILLSNVDVQKMDDVLKVCICNQAEQKASLQQLLLQILMCSLNTECQRIGRFLRGMLSSGEGGQNCED